MMAPMPSKSPAKRPAFMLSVTETDSASSAPSSTPTSNSGKLFPYYIYLHAQLRNTNLSFENSIREK